MLRRGVSLIEVLIAIAILGALVGLTLSAIQRVRTEALRTQSSNNLRQIIVATHDLSASRTDRIGGLTRTDLPRQPLYTESSIFTELLPWLLGQRTLASNETDSERIMDYMLPKVNVYISPADPSLSNPSTLPLKGRGVCSYACNMLAFDGALVFPIAIGDGTSNTIAYAERYFFCGATQEITLYHYIFDSMPGTPVGGIRRATFADRGWSDVVPVADASSGLTVASIRGTTFQVRPKYEDIADSKQLQTPHPSGLPVALFDGSVRTLSPRISEVAFWSMITPNGGEVSGGD